MNEDILKEAVGKGSYLSYHWRQYTFEQLEKENKRLCNIIKEQQSIIIKYGNFETERNSRRANEAYASIV